MTVARLIELLQQQPSDSLVYYDDAEWGAQEVDEVAFVRGATHTRHEREERERVMAYHNGEEVEVEVPKFVTYYEPHPGVVLS